MGISPEATETRAIAVAMAGAGTPLLEAARSGSPAHPRALSTLREATAPWEGKKIHAALVAVGSASRSDSSRYRDSVSRHGRPLYALAWVPAFGAPRRATHDDVRCLLRPKDDWDPTADRSVRGARFPEMAGGGDFAAQLEDDVILRGGHAIDADVTLGRAP